MQSGSCSEKYLELAENPGFRFVVSNTTEAGIVFSEVDRETDEPPKNFPAKVALLLKKRYELGLPGFIFLPCELIEHNGDQLKKCILQYAKLWNWEDNLTLDDKSAPCDDTKAEFEYILQHEIEPIENLEEEEDEI